MMAPFILPSAKIAMEVLASFSYANLALVLIGIFLRVPLEKSMSKQIRDCQRSSSGLSLLSILDFKVNSSIFLFKSGFSLFSFILFLKITYFSVGQGLLIW